MVNYKDINKNMHFDISLNMQLASGSTCLLNHVPGYIITDINDINKMRQVGTSMLLKLGWATGRASDLDLSGSRDVIGHVTI